MDFIYVHLFRDFHPLKVPLKNKLIVFQRCWAQHESGTSESATVYQGEAGYIQQDTGLSDCSGLLDNIVTCSEMEETIFCNQDYLGNNPRVWFPIFSGSIWTRKDL